jgi:hypothetical protein
MQVAIEPDVFRRLDLALERKVRQAIQEWMAQGAPGLLMLHGAEATQVRILGQVHISGAVWN